LSPVSFFSKKNSQSAKGNDTPTRRRHERWPVPRRRYARKNRNQQINNYEQRPEPSAHSARTFLKVWILQIFPRLVFDLLLHHSGIEAECCENGCTKDDVADEVLHGLARIVSHLNRAYAHTIHRDLRTQHQRKAAGCSEPPQVHRR
jgi:hypothetical protein